MDRIHLDDCYRRPFPESKKQYQLQQEKGNNDEFTVELKNDVVIFRDTIKNISINYNGSDKIFEEIDAERALRVSENLTLPKKSIIRFKRKTKKSKKADQPKVGEEE